MPQPPLPLGKGYTASRRVSQRLSTLCEAFQRLSTLGAKSDASTTSVPIGTSPRRALLVDCLGSIGECWHRLPCIRYAPGLRGISSAARAHDAAASSYTRCSDGRAGWVSMLLL